jgi:peptide/nickel transport system ATP-binding protein
MLSIQNLSVTFTMYEVGLAQKQLTTIVDLDLEVNAGEVVAVVGSSGSGKSLLAHAVLGILPHNARVNGTMLFKGEPLTLERQATLRGKEIALIPQSVSYLDPLMPVGAQVLRSAQLSGVSTANARQSVDLTFSRYGLDSEVKHRYPFQISGGMARRVLVATAAIGKADLVIADEPTSSLNPELVAETLNHLRELATAGKGIILITHDLEAALQIADKVAVFYAGTTVEITCRENFIQGNLYHPYTYALWRSLPQNDFIPVPGTQPSPDVLPTGCLFGDRCSHVTEDCLITRPQLRQIQNAQVRCIHAKG